jgi:hypothetical protein
MPCDGHHAPCPFQQCNVQSGGSQPLLTFLGPQPMLMFDLGGAGMLACGRLLRCSLGFQDLGLCPNSLTH